LQTLNKHNTIKPLKLRGYSSNWLVCITETECVYCAVRKGSLYMIQANLRLIRVLDLTVPTNVPVPTGFLSSDVTQ